MARPPSTYRYSQRLELVSPREMLRRQGVAMQELDCQNLCAIANHEGVDACATESGRASGTSDD